MRAAERANLIDVIRGRVAADVVITNGILVNTLTREVYQADVAVKGDTIAMVGNVSHTIGGDTHLIDASQHYIVPGLIEHHVHTFESQITPTQFARLTLPHGTTTYVTDEYGVGVVGGIQALRFVMDEAKRLPQRVFFMYPLGTGYIQNRPFGHTGHLGEEDLRELMNWQEWHGVSELYPHLVYEENDPFVIEMMEEAEKRGLLTYTHTRLVRGSAVQALLLLNLGAMDHECTRAEEVIEKARLGERISLKGRQFRRYGDSPQSSGAEFLEPLINGVIDSRRFTVNTDTASPAYLAENGHIDFIVRMGVRRGIDPMTMIQMATINAAEFMRIDHLVGSIAPGKLADILLVDNLADWNVQMVMVDGRVVARDGRVLVNLENPDYPSYFRNTVRFAPPEAAQFRIEAPSGAEMVRVRVLVDAQDPEKRANAGCDVEELTLAVDQGAIVADPARRIAKVVVMDRHSSTGKIGKGFAKGPYLAQGAVGTSYTNQTEDVAIVGMTDEDIALCALTLQEMGGGWCAVLNGRVLAKVEMPLCGLMADEPFEQTVDKMKAAYAIGREILGSELEDPYRGPGKLAMCVTHSPTYHIGREGLVRPFERVPLIVD